MKTFAAVVLTGLLGVVAGSLAAQPPEAERVGASRGVIYEGAVEVLLTGEGVPGEERGNARVYDGWVVFDNPRKMIPREQIRWIMLGEGERAEDFGDTPEADRPNRPTRPFRED